MPYRPSKYKHTLMNREEHIWTIIIPCSRVYTTRSGGILYSHSTYRVQYEYSSIGDHFSSYVFIRIHLAHTYRRINIYTRTYKDNKIYDMFTTTSHNSRTNTPRMARFIHKILCTSILIIGRQCNICTMYENQFHEISAINHRLIIRKYISIYDAMALFSR